MDKAVCSICGREFDLWDRQGSFGFDRHVGYGSKYDGEHIKVRLCCDCFDELMDTYILPMCKIRPMKGGEAV